MFSFNRRPTFATKNAACPIARAVRTTLEGLEARQLLANDPLTVGTLKVGTAVWLNVIGTANEDAIVITQTSKTAYSISNGTWTTTKAGTFTGVRVAAGAGDDSVSISGVWATRTNILGEAGNDTLVGGLGIDVINGGVGDDWLDGNDGNDNIVGIDGNDTLNGGTGNDSLNGGLGDDQINGNEGNDTLLGDAGNDSLDGGAADDSLMGGAGDDVIDGDIGNDRLIATLDTGNDVYIGGDGLDYFDYTGRTAALTITLDGQANDGQSGEADNVGSDLESIIGGNGADTITGNALANIIYGGLGNDTINGGAGDDKLYGGAGMDSISGGNGDDSLYGQADADQLYGESGDDLLEGGLGNDDLYGGDGRDSLISLGGGTADSITGGAGLDSFWMDFDATEKLQDISADETAAKAEHRVKAFVNEGKTVVSKEVTGQALPDPIGSGKLVNFKTNKLFADAGPSQDDIHQGQAGDCWYLSTLSAIAKVNAEVIRQAVTSLGDGTYAVRFANATNGTDQYVRVDADLYTYTWSATTQMYTTSGEEGSIWAPILEKALTWVRGSRLGTYATITSGWMSEASARLGIASVSSSPSGVGSVTGMVNWLRDQLDQNKAVTIGTPGVQAGVPLIGGHAYLVDHVTDNHDGTFSVTVRNPWGVDGIGNDGANDGYVTITAGQLYANCSGMSAAAA